MLPPAVAGIALLAAVGPEGILGGALEAAGIELSLTTAGVVVALTFVASPFYVRQAMAAFASVDRTLLDASRTLGASEARGFVRVMIPAAMPGLVAGGALALGRALGEFGATLMFAGSFQGITQTVPLAIYDRFSTDFQAALALSAVLVAVSAAILLSVKLVHGTRGARRCSALRRAPALGALELDVALEVAAGRVPGRGRALGRGQDQRAARGRGPAAPRARARRRPAARPGSTRARGIDVPPERRRCGYLFQEYALFPHMSAWQNVAYPLRGLRRGERRARALELLERFGMARPGRRASADAVGRRAAAGGAGPGARAPTRTCCCSTSRCRRSTPAPARAPRASWRRCCARSRCPRCSSPTTSPRPRSWATGSGVIDAGRVVQEGTPSELAAAPRSAFVADFTGAVVLTGTARAGADGLTHVDLDGGGAVASTDRAEGPVAVSVYPWEIAIEPAGEAPHGSARTACRPRCSR